MASLGKEMAMKLMVGSSNRSICSATHFHFASPFGGSLVFPRTWHTLIGWDKSGVKMECGNSYHAAGAYMKSKPSRLTTAAASSSSSSLSSLRADSVAAMDSTTPTKLDYYEDMLKLQSTAQVVSYFKGEDGRHALILDRTVFHPQGGGQPADTGFITIANSDYKFVVEDVRSKDGIVYHYGFIENSSEVPESEFEKGKDVLLDVNESRRKLNARLHSAGHLLDACMPKIGLGDLEPTKGYHFPDGPWVEYKGKLDPKVLESKQKELESEANALISKGGKVIAAILPYDEAAEMCDGSLPSYIPKDSTPRIIKLGDTPGCPCGGTHVPDIADIKSITVSQMRIKKGLTKVFYNIE